MVKPTIETSYQPTWKIVDATDEHCVLLSQLAC
jgi:hypothetical protein